MRMKTRYHSFQIPEVGKRHAANDPSAIRKLKRGVGTVGVDAVDGEHRKLLLSRKGWFMDFSRQKECDNVPSHTLSMDWNQWIAGLLAAGIGGDRSNPRSLLKKLLGKERGTLCHL